MHDKTSEEQKCRCGEDETVEHVLLHCAVLRKVTEQRQTFLA